jgi:hypothetical protein
MRGAWGVDAWRGVQHQGGHDSPDVKHRMPGVLVEVKRCEQLSLYPALDKLDGETGDEEHGILLHRRNGKDWVLVMFARDFPAVIVDYLTSIGIDTEALGIDGKLF